MAVARRFAVGGYQVTLVARSTEGLRDLAGTVADTGGKINTIAADASDPDGLGARTCHRALMAVLSMTGSAAAAVTWPYGRRP
jgi:short-subunit dehydrogenase